MGRWGRLEGPAEVLIGSAGQLPVKVLQRLTGRFMPYILGDGQIPGSLRNLDRQYVSPVVEGVYSRSWLDRQLTG